MLTILAQSGESGFWLPHRASTFADSVDGLWWFLIIISTICFIGIGGTMFAVAILFRQKDKDKVAHGHTHNTALEITWSVIPLFIVLGVFAWGFRGFLDMATPPDNSMEILVRSYQWGWDFQYPNGATSNELHVPVDKPVKLVLQSADVIHSFYVPAFRIKKDAVPGRYNKTWFLVRSEDNPFITDGHPGIFDLFCAEYCGTNHSTMLTKVNVYTAADWPGKFAEVSNPYTDTDPPWVNGRLVFEKKGCKTCHSVDGSPGTGPTFKNLFGYPQQLDSGETKIADEAFIRQAILYPNSQGIKGFTQQMPAVVLKEQELEYVIAFIKSLSDKYDPGMDTGAPAPAPGTSEGEAQTGDAGTQNAEGQAGN